MVELANPASPSFSPVLNDYHHPSDDNQDRVTMLDSPAPPSLDHIRKRTVRANGLDFPILEAGSGPLVLCLHGFPDHAQSWVHFLDRLAQEGYWAVAPALRGYWVGGAAPDGSYRALATGQDVLALIEALGAEQADLIGHDFGARAVYAAASLDAAPRPQACRVGSPLWKGTDNSIRRRW
jgi:alpha-beta hydrolase superfamily lysophospholipase